MATFWGLLIAVAVIALVFRLSWNNENNDFWNDNDDEVK